MNKQSYQIQNLSKLLRLQRSRIAIAEAAYRTSQAECDKINQAMQQRQARIESMQQQLDTLNNYGFEHDVNERVRFADFASARACWLRHDLERDEYWLKDDQRELSDAETKVTAARRSWLQSRSRETSMQRLLKEAQCHQLREVEMRLEAEATEEFSISGLTKL